MLDTKTIQTERLTLRKVTMEDISDFHEYASDTIMTEYLDWESNSIEKSESYIRYIMSLYKNSYLPHWVIIVNETNKLIGRCSVSKYYQNDKTVEIGYSIASKYWAKGYMTECVNAVTDYIFSEKIIRVEAMTLKSNFASRKVLKKCGFEKEGTLKKRLVIKGKSYDAEMWSKINFFF